MAGKTTQKKTTSKKPAPKKATGKKAVAKKPEPKKSTQKGGADTPPPSTEGNAGKKLPKRCGAPPFYATADELEDAVLQYLEDCRPKPITYTNADGLEIVATDKNGRAVFQENPPTIHGLAYSLGYESRQSMYDIEKRGEDFSYVIKRARLFMAAYHERNLSTRDKCVGDIFWFKALGDVTENQDGDTGAANEALIRRQMYDEAFGRSADATV